MRRLFFLLLIFSSLTVRAEVQEREIIPSNTDPEISTVTGPHRVYWNPVHSNGQLLITLGGTGSASDRFQAVNRLAAELGFHVLALDYPDKVTTVKCLEHYKSGCFEKFHQAIVLGQPGSELVTVNAANSIAYRLQELLTGLALKDQQWKAFMKNGRIDWSRTWIAGHSQGTGHAAFLSKLHKFGRVILFAGPQDNDGHGPEAWLARPGATPRDRYYAFLHKDDPYHSDWQLQNLRQLVGGRQVPVQASAGEAASFDTRKDIRVVIASEKVADPHTGLILDPQYEKVWRYLLTPTLAK